MTRSKSETLEFELEIEKLARSLWREAIRRRKQSQVKESEYKTMCYTKEIDDTLSEPKEMANQTIWQLAMALDEQQPFCITYLTGGTPFELKSGLIHLLPTFRGLQNKNPHTQLKEFHMICQLWNLKE